MATLAELDALVDANPDAARGIAAAYEVLLGGVPSIDGFVFLINNAKSTNFGSNNPNVTFNQENIFINLTNALVQGNPTAKANFDAITAGAATLGDKLAEIYDAFVPLDRQTTEGRAFFARPEAQAFYQQVAAERGVAGADGASIVALASLIKILVSEDIGVGDSVNDLIAAINDGSAALPTNGALTPIETADGTHFDADDPNPVKLLTTGVDTIPGTNGDDIIRGDVVQTAFLPIQTLNSGDSIDGGAGRDTVEAQLADFLVQPVALTDVEVLNLENAPLALGLAVGPRVVDAINANAIDEIGFRSPNANIITGLGVVNVASDVTEVNIQDSLGLGVPVNHGVTFIGATVRDTIDVNLDNVVNTALTLQGGGYETVNLDSAGPVDNSFALIVVEMETLNITGDADLVVLNDLEIQPLALVDASGFTGDLGIDLSNDADDGLDGVNDEIEVRGGSGDDGIVFEGNFDSDATVSGGAGDDLIGFESLGSNGAVSFTATDSVDGGAGDDVLEIEVRDGPGGVQALLGAGVGANIVGIERIRHESGFMNDDLTVDWTRKGSATELEFAGDYSSRNVAVTGLTNTDTVFYTGNGIRDLSLTSLNGAGSLSNVINLEIVTTLPSDFRFMASLTVDPETEMLNLTGTGPGTILIGNVSAVESDVTIETTAALTFGPVGAYDFAGGTIDGSASTGDLVIYLGANEQSVSGGSGDDLILLQDFNVADLVVLGAGGADTVSFENAFNFAVVLDDLHSVTGFAVADDVIRLDDNVGFGATFVDTAGNALIEPVAGRNIVAGENANLQGSDFGFIKFTTAVATTGASTADSVFEAALGAGSINVGTNPNEGILGLAYDATNERMVIFQIVDTTGNNIAAGADDTAWAVGTVDMSYADFLAFSGANIDFMSV